LSRLRVAFSDSGKGRTDSAGIYFRRGAYWFEWTEASTCLYQGESVRLLLRIVRVVTKSAHIFLPAEQHAAAMVSSKRFPALAFEAGDADFIAENLNSVIQSCQNDR
jgi:hypothetical protein